MAYSWAMLCTQCGHKFTAPNPIGVVCPQCGSADTKPMSEIEAEDWSEAPYKFSTAEEAE